MTYLAIPIKVEDFEQAKRDVCRAIDHNAELLELRFDYLAEWDPQIIRDIVKMALACSRPVVATCRVKAEGGAFTGSEEQRLKILALAAESGANYVDVELSSIGDGELPGQSAGRIISNHDFYGLPKDLARRVALIKEKGVGVLKIAYKAQKITDSFAALDILNQEKGSIAIAMGAEGVITRLAARKLDALLTFVSLDDESVTASGQVTVNEMCNVYRWDKIDAYTQLFGVIGRPVGHSMSPVIHNTAFSYSGFNGLYIPLLVADDKDVFNNFIDGVRRRPWLDMRGFSVTIPHKRNAIEYVKSVNGYLEPLAERIGAVNTLILDSNEGIGGYNTDYAGAMEAITETLDIERRELDGVSVAIVGAGGVARALAAGFTDVGAKVTIYNRTIEKARALAEEFGCEVCPLERLSQLDARILINCTSVGMHPNRDETPVPAELLKRDMVVFDTVYNPAETLLLKNARQAGAQVIDGVTMFVNQAALQFEMFTNSVAPRHLMRQTVLAWLD